MANGLGHHEIEEAVALNALILFPYGACHKPEAYFWSDPSLRSRSDLASANSACFSPHFFLMANGHDALIIHHPKCLAYRLYL